MRLFFQLSDEEKEAVFDDFFSQVMMDILENDMNIDDSCSDLTGKKEELLKLIEDARAEEDEEKKVSMLLDNEDMGDIIRHFAMEMAANAFYHEPGEIVCFPHTLVSNVCPHCGEEGEECFEDDEECLELPEIDKKNSKNEMN